MCGADVTAPWQRGCCRSAQGASSYLGLLGFVCTVRSLCRLGGLRVSVERVLDWVFKDDEHPDDCCFTTHIHMHIYAQA